MRVPRFVVAVGAACVFLGAGMTHPGLAQTAPPNGAACLPPPVRTESARPWAQQMLSPERAWDLTRGAGITVAVIDSGVDGRTPQLAGAVLPGVDVLSPNGGSANTDCLGHGTFVAGIVAAHPVPGIGFAGIAPEAKILPIRDTNTKDGGTTQSMANGIREAVDAGARVINISASSSYPDDTLRAAVDYASARDVLIVAAAANTAQQGNPVTYPASYPGVLAVGAINSANAPAAFSQTGSFVGLVAPGVDVIGVGPGGPGHWQDSGTSFAAPFVAGTATLVRAYHPHLTAQEVRHRLQATATRPGVSVPDPAMGWGTVNPYAAVASVLPEEGTGGQTQRVAHPLVPADNPVPLQVLSITTATMILLICLAAIGAKLGPTGWRRGWRRPRVLRVVDGDDRTPTRRQPDTSVE